MDFTDFKKFLGFKAVEQKAATSPVDGYEGANRFSTDRSYILSTVEPNFGDATPYARTELLSLSRYAVRNFAVVEKILSSVSQYVVGAGITAQAATSNAEFNTEATNHFDQWAVSPFCTVNNDLNFYDLTKLAVRELLVAGEIFFVFSKAESGFPQLIAVASEQVKHSGKKTDKSIDGIFYDAKGKAIAYQIFFNEKTATRVEAANVIHLKVTKQVNQRRGVSMFASSLNSLRDLYDLHNLFKKSAKVHASLAAAVTRKSGDAATQGVFGNQNAAGKKPACSSPKANDRLEKAFAGAVAYLQEGESVELLTSSHPQDGYFKHLQTLLNEVCMSIGLNYAFLIDTSALTSAGTRFVIADADAFFKNLQDLIIYGCTQRIYTWVIASAINGKLISKSTDAQYWKTAWVTPERITIDKGREDRTTLEFVQNGLMSLDAYYASRGKDYKEQLEQIAQEKQLIAKLEEKYGVKIMGEPSSSAPVVTPSPDPDNESEPLAA